MTPYGLGYVPDKQDARDHALKLTAPAKLPALVDLRGNRNYPAAYDQGQIGSCVGNAVAFAVSHALHIPAASSTFSQLSRLQIYYGARDLEGNAGQDVGCQLRDAIKVVAKQGVVDEALWDYESAHVFTPPPAEIIAAGAGHAAVQYARLLPDVDMICTALASGHPVVFGTMVYPSFLSDEVRRTGNVPMPEIDVQPLGGHAMTIVGYDTKRGVFIIRNSWSSAWGDQGSAYMPFDYVANLRYSSDFWVIQRAGTAA